MSPAVSSPHGSSAAARRFLAAITQPVEHRPAPPPTLLLVAHPDDEVVGAGGQLEWLVPALHVVHLTPGVPVTLDPEQRAAYRSPETYGANRARELDAVLSRAGLPRDRRHRLGGADQRCARQLVELTWELRALLDTVAPEVLLTHPYEGGHPDHDAAAFAAQHACMRIAAAPARLEFTSYHLSDGAFACGGFLPGGPDHATTHLDEGQRGFKRELMTLYVSQRHVLAQFAPDIERFRVAPQYDFAQPPHAPPLHYELYAWGMDGAAFRSLATDAALTLTTEDGCP